MNDNDNRDYEKEFLEIKKRCNDDGKYRYIFHLLKIYKRLFREESKRTGIPEYKLYARFFATYYFCFNSPGEYIIGERYKLSIKEQKKLMTWKKWIELDDKYNKNILPKEGIVFFRKELFAKVFEKYFGRDFLYAPDATTDEIKEFVKKHNRVFCKPIESGGGKGIFDITIDSMTDDLIKRAKQDCLIEEAIIQHSEMSSINPTSVNDLRIITAIDREGIPHIVSTHLRAGMPGSIVDNSSSGGISYMVDVENGIVVECGQRDEYVGEYYKHPGTEKDMIGFKIPNFEIAKNMALEATKVLPSARWVGWDIAIREKDVVLIEGNITYPQGNTNDSYQVLKQYL